MFAKANIQVLAVSFFPCPAACLADSRSTAGGREEPQLLSDVNAAQPLCLCGHSPSNSSNQLMGYLTLPSSPQQLSSAVSLNLVMDVVVELEQMLTAHDDMSCHSHLFVVMPVKATECI